MPDKKDSKSSDASNASLISLIDERFDDLKSALKLSAVGAVGLEALTDEGRALMGSGFETVGEYVTTGRNFVVNMIRGFAGINRVYYAWMSLFGALVILSSAFATEWPWRIALILANVVCVVLLIINRAIAGAEFCVTAGGLTKGLEAIDEAKIASLLRGNPFPLIFSTVKPAYGGVTSYVFGWFRHKSREMMIFSIASLYFMAPFHQNKPLLLFAPILVFIIIGLVTGYEDKKKFQFWWFSLYFSITALIVLAVLAFLPVLSQYAQSGGQLAMLITLLVIGALVYNVWKQASKQMQKSDANGKPGMYSGSRSSGLSGGQMGMLAWGSIQILVIIAIGAWAFGGCYRDSDGFRKVVGIAPALARSGLSVYPIPPRGVDGVPGVTAGQVGSGSVSVAGDYETVTYPVRLKVDLGKLGSGIKVTSGDRVRIEVSPSTRSYLAQGERSMQSISIAGKFTDDGNHLLPSGRLLELYDKDYPMLNKAEGGLIMQDGAKGERAYVGIGAEFTVPEPPKPRELFFFLNLPQRSELRGMLAPNQHIDLTITVTRRR